jgi:hypothetical protein
MKYIHDAGWIIILALFWAISGYVIGAAFEYVGVPYRVGLMLASVNVIIGMLLLKGVISDSFGDRMFFEGPKGNDDGGDIRVGCLWLIPANWLLIGGVLWLGAILVRFIGK